MSSMVVGSGSADRPRRLRDRFRPTRTVAPNRVRVRGGDGADLIRVALGLGRADRPYRPREARRRRT